MSPEARALIKLRAYRLRALGNAVVWPAAFIAGIVLRSMLAPPHFAPTAFGSGA